MKNVVINISNLSKQYRLGTIGSSSLKSDINRLWAKLKGQPDPSLKITDENILHSYDKSIIGDNNSKYIWALNEINIKVEKGEIIGIIGANGAGKSTLLKILSRITLPTSGEIKVKGSIGSLLEVGTGFHPELTGLENIYLNGTILGMNRKQISSQLDNIIKFSGVDSFINTPIKRYSTGMKVRLGFSVAAHLEPEILIVDEVLAVGDLEFQRKAISKMSNVSEKQGKTILFVSHNMQAIKSLTNRCILLDKGKVVNDGTPDAVISEYMIKSKKKKSLVNNQMENDIFSLNQAIVSDSSGNERDVFEQNNDIIIKIDYNLKKSIQNLRICYLLKDNNDLIIYKSTDSLDGIRPRDFQQSGRYRVKTIIPGNFLNEGDYNIALIIDTPKGFIDQSQRFVTTICKFNNVINIKIIFADKKIGQIREIFPGILFPKLEWETKKIPN